VKPIETERLVLRRLRLADAAFIRALVNEPSWLAFIGDKGVRTLADARRYLRSGPLAMYRGLGFGLYRVERAADGAVLGICGLVKRDGLDDVDIGYALLRRFWGSGYAREAAEAVVEHARRDIGLDRIVAVTAPGNAASSRLLEALGFAFAGMVTLQAGRRVSRLYARDLRPGAQPPFITVAK
jgi:RimJ/RimL family protein N-acetyltransferase